jgi:hypothetical protein
LLKSGTAKFCTTKLLTASSAFFGDFAFASIAVSAAEKRDYEEVFIVCQVSVVRFTHFAVLPTTPSGLTRFAPGFLFSSYRNIRVNPKFSVTAKPETITQLLQIMQPAFA